MIKYAELRLKLRMRALKLVLTLKACLSGKSVVYASYKRSELALLISESIHR